LLPRGRRVRPRHSHDGLRLILRLRGREAVRVSARRAARRAAAAAARRAAAAAAAHEAEGCRVAVKEVDGERLDGSVAAHLVRG